MVLRELGCCQEAREALLTSLNIQPLFWGAWSELVGLCESREMVNCNVIVPLKSPAHHAHSSIP